MKVSGSGDGAWGWGQRDLNNLIEESHQPTRRREWKMQRFKSARHGRTPDLVVKLLPGFLFDGNTMSTVKRAEHGGLVPDDLAVPLILSGSGLGAGLQGTTVSSPVLTTQVAPTILFELGLDPSALDGVRLEGTAVLPGLNATSVPEPASLAVLGSTVLLLAGMRRRR